LYTQEIFDWYLSPEEFPERITPGVVAVIESCTSTIAGLRTLIETIHQEAADLYADGDKSRISLFIEGKRNGDVQIRVDGEVIESFWRAADNGGYHA